VSCAHLTTRPTESRQRERQRGNGVELTDAQLRARTFARAVSSLRERWTAQPMRDLRDSPVDPQTRQALSALAVDCVGLLEEHGSRLALDALVGLDPDALVMDPDRARPGRAAQAKEVTKETVLDWLDLVCDALRDRYPVPRGGTFPHADGRRRTVSAPVPPPNRVNEDLSARREVPRPP
jgi:hypothetical protein